MPEPIVSHSRGSAYITTPTNNATTMAAVMKTVAMSTIATSNAGENRSSSSSGSSLGIHSPPGAPTKIASTPPGCHHTQRESIDGPGRRRDAPGMKRWAIVAVVAISSCSSGSSSGSGTSTEEFASLMETKTRFDEVIDVMVATKETARSLFEIEDPYSDEGLAAVARVRETWKSAQTAVEDAETGLPADLQDEWSVVSEDVATAAAMWRLALAKIESLVVRLKPLADAGGAVEAADAAGDAADESLALAFREMDRLECEGLGDQWNAQAAECVGADPYG